MRYLSILLILVSFELIAQKKIRTLEVSDTILNAYVDRPGDLYILTKGGHIHKYDIDGALSILFKTHGMPTLFDPRDGARLFAYYRETQHYEYLTPSFEVVNSYRIDSSFVIQPWLICPSGDYKLWVLDAADHSLKKINPRDSEVEVEVSIDASLIKNVRRFDTMREYQGFVFLHEQAKGIHIFNGMGKHIKTIEDPAIQSFNFLGEELYYLSHGKLKFLDLFSAETREAEPIEKSHFVLMSDVRHFYVLHKMVEIFRVD